MLSFIKKKKKLNIQSIHLTIYINKKEQIKEKVLTKKIEGNFSL